MSYIDFMKKPKKLTQKQLENKLSELNNKPQRNPVAENNTRKGGPMKLSKDKKEKTKEEQRLEMSKEAREFLDEFE